MVDRTCIINSFDVLYKCFIIIQYVPISGHIALIGLGLEPLHASVRHELRYPMPVRMQRTGGWRSRRMDALRILSTN